MIQKQLMLLLLSLSLLIAGVQQLTAQVQIYLDDKYGTPDNPDGFLRSLLDFILSNGKTITPEPVLNRQNAPPQFIGIILDEKEREAGTFIEQKNSGINLK